ncbi:ent-kaurene synthetase A-like protein [Arabidopsis thaliana]|uniref:Ent-copalyl diphosphate synthase, chloroplastic n=3 Tax=Pentapetalae TaxID=1437201 RepID=KSA_ARATH|nr:Terpenoid cyclases/Protein prenyltransferases superfamily protein [Arabidopsis thaliana]Q38802.1 RecName: Full=Ent-copalyl diphosphate synthase, chloroplastic; Short=AtCPS; Short=Ent-CDP synthase; AltName: Full=Ent-kaurene synthase A; Short=KSA; AltName: Full=Protein GA REQUIRING 1; Flags: Precursor [Arabidopsis thaliana]AVZ65968.1 Aro8 [Plectranthus barbatus]KAG7619424.1 Terpene synthase N-terminal domain [Arabidopsis suecica]AAA53632.1 ent-kaurene synthetase A [Arabidopsis thaliana]AAD153|eukprot:NP_192187.1 Terpenoid cyclases/Protein prenyltransferases superfamily protein [Arabidopsis thaliana]
MSLQYHVLNSIPSTTFLSSTKTTISSSFLTISGSPLNVARDKSRSGSIHCSKLRTQEYINSQEVQHDLPLIHEWQQLQGEDAPQISVGSNSNAFKEAVKSVKTILRNLTDGEITISAYDTAWVALIDAGDKTPAFPSAVKWIAENQLSDGSWGDAYLFSYHDRLINTLACVVALRSWNLFPHQCNKGITFFRENIGKLEDENDEHMPIGFEVAFPSLLEIARGINIDVPYDSPVLKDIYAKKELKLTRIPKEIMHKIPTTLLHSLEGMRDLDWEKLLKLQSQDGSFLFSPSSTAFAFMQTRDSNCLEYLRNAVKRFNGGVPNVFPVDLFEHIWIVDRLQRLGISRYFEEEIKECLDYVHRYWTDNGICWARCSHVQDIDDTAMAFRLLRQHGYQVSADVFKNFEKEGEFFCFVGQSNQAVTGMFNLYRASQLAFPREEILKNAKEFSYNYLLEKREREELIDKWIIMKDLPGEIGFALEIPWYASLPRVETRFYIDQYGGENDVWIGKTLYRMPYVNNNGYLELAKQDYNNCQAQHQLEWDIFQKWYEENRLSEWGVRRSELLECYYLAAATIFESERSHERMVWAKSSVLVKAISSSFGESSDSRRSFSDQFHEYIANARRSDHHFNDRNMRLDRPGSVQASRLAGVLIGTLNQMSFDLFMSHGRDVNNLLYLSWGDWMEKWKLYGDEGEGELMVKMIILMKNNDLTNFFTHTHFVRLAEIINRICLPRQYLKARRNDEKEKTIKSMEKEMGKMVELALSESDTFRDVSITFLDVAKAFYYFALCGDHLQTHISKVLFQKV